MDIIYILIACTFFNAPGASDNQMSASCITSPPVTLDRCLKMSLQLRDEGVLLYTSCVQFIEEERDYEKE